MKANNSKESKSTPRTKTDPKLHGISIDEHNKPL